MIQGYNRSGHVTLRVSRVHRSSSEIHRGRVTGTSPRIHWLLRDAHSVPANALAPSEYQQQYLLIAQAAPAVTEQHHAWQLRPLRGQNEGRRALGRCGGGVQERLRRVDERFAAALHFYRGAFRFGPPTSLVGNHWPGGTASRARCRRDAQLNATAARCARRRCARDEKTRAPSTPRHRRRDDADRDRRRDDAAAPTRAPSQAPRA